MVAMVAATMSEGAVGADGIRANNLIPQVFEMCRGRHLLLMLLGREQQFVCRNVTRSPSYFRVD